jgi:hypothetical protein
MIKFFSSPVQINNYSWDNSWNIFLTPLPAMIYDLESIMQVMAGIGFAFQNETNSIGGRGNRIRMRDPAPPNGESTK